MFFPFFYLFTLLFSGAFATTIEQEKPVTKLPLFQRVIEAFSGNDMASFDRLLKDRIGNNGTSLSAPVKAVEFWEPEITERDLEIVDSLLQGASPLAIALRNGAETVVKKLVEAGATLTESEQKKFRRLTQKKFPQSSWNPVGVNCAKIDALRQIAIECDASRKELILRVLGSQSTTPPSSSTRRHDVCRPGVSFLQALKRPRQ